MFKMPAIHTRQYTARGYELGVDVVVPSSSMSPEDELKAKKAALETLQHYGVFQDVPRSESGSLKKIRARWEPQASGDTVKWRYAAQEF